MKKLSHFTIPDKKTREAAIGSLKEAPSNLRKALTVITALFDPITKPGPNDWLANHNEEGQTFQAYLKEPKNYVDKQRNVIYIQPVEETIDKEFLECLRKFTMAYYYGLNVKVLPYLNIEKMKIGSRINDWSGKLQYNATHILRNLEGKLPSDAYCLIAVSLTDLYPRDEWNFVFGLASLKNRTGVFSFARYQDSFYQSKTSVSTMTDKWKILWRSSKVMVHEIGHMFGLNHCIYFNCIMNGTNHLEENDRRPIFMCPVCLRKLQHNIDFEITERYRALRDVCSQFDGNFKVAAQWYENAQNLILKEIEAENHSEK